ncbi:hypothetical protein LAZ67_11002171 [Cordylochernes scorpioides]|uniref:PiggyBac transposable element-derived protein domain-containing protein n=1 Tax=Cordylochernes scorpioides TaxID=51811 RepID=A0ABY6KZ24_9ARAC|nr:hypothetical protein LAZ67_11002171 [Cordylochernes scorpioides]
MILNPSWNLQLPVSMWGETRQRGGRPVNVKVQRTFVTFWDKKGLPSFLQEIWTDDGTGFEIFRYVVNIEIYPGKQPEGPYQISNSPNNVVERLVLPISGSKRNITTDNWYTSYTLAVALLRDHELTLLGTLKKKKKKHLNLCRGARQVFSSIFGFHKNVSLVSYVPKMGKRVILLSTMHSTATIDEETNEKKKPEMITFYSMTKGGMNLLDQKTSLYSVGRRTKRWPLCIFFELLNIAGVNSKLILMGINPKNIYRRRKDFLTEYHHIKSTTKSFSKLLRNIVRKHSGQSPVTIIDKKGKKESSHFIVDLGRALTNEHLATRNLNSLALELQTTIQEE